MNKMHALRELPPHINDLIYCGLISLKSSEVYSRGTRDSSEITVYRDTESGVIYNSHSLDTFSTYSNSEYRESIRASLGQTTDCPSLDQVFDIERRANDFLHLYYNKHIIDFGCGKGDFIIKVSPQTLSSTGIEIDLQTPERLSSFGIPCYNDIGKVCDLCVDTVFLFHSFEHLTEPIATLTNIKNLLRPGGHIVIEVPHANDALLSLYNLEKFKAFTLWSQHLILHTTSSLHIMLQWCGFEVLQVSGVQRFGFANHINWLVNQFPGGHSSGFESIYSEELNRQYAACLSRSGLSDTLYAIARRPK